MDRIYLSQSELSEVEKQARYLRHLERYCHARSCAYGNVLDFGCGVGYGSHLLSRNPDVHSVYGIDISSEAISFAKNTYGGSRVTFATNIPESSPSFDVLVALEIIEHIPDETELPSLARRLQIPKIIVSFPHIKSTHFNPHHYHDFTVQRIRELFDGWVVLSERSFSYDSTILELVADPRRWRCQYLPC